MKKILLTGLMLSALQFNSLSQCSETSENKILLVGDSWAFFMGVDQTINTVMDNWGHSNYTYFTNPTIAENGAETDDFLTTAKQQEIQNQLDSKPSIKAVHLSIGGNDVLGDWDVSFSQQQTDSLENAVFQRLDSVITFIKSARPGIHIVWSGYAYPNFEEVIQSAAPFQTQHPFYSRWEAMGFPSFLQLNTILNDFSDRIANFYANDPQVTFIPATGLMQYQYGQTTALGVAPGGTYAPFSVPLPIGDPTYPSPKNTMRDYGITKDCFHLSASGFRTLISYHTQKFYHKFLMDDFYALSNASETGSVSSTGATSGIPKIGDDAGQTFASQVSFNITVPAGNGVQKASIFMHIDAIQGTNLLDGTISIKSKNGSFGAAAVEAGDFSAAGDFVGNPCQFGSKSQGNWVRFDLPTSLASEIQDGLNQFIITATNASNQQVVFSNSDDADFAPVMNIKYINSVSSVNEIAQEKMKVYPNPTTGIVHLEITSSVIKGIEITDLAGRKMPVNQYTASSIDISTFPAGVYMLSIETQQGKQTQRIVKAD